MTSSRTVLIEPSCLFRQGLKHLLADTRFAVEVEFSTIEQAVGDTVASGLADLRRFDRDLNHSQVFWWAKPLM